MAEVYRARGRGADGTEYLYALKRILPEYTRDPEIKKMFIEESRVAACLVHPNVVRVYDLATSENEELYIVMEFLEGKDLSEAIEEAGNKRRSLPIWFALQIAKEVLRALHYVTLQATDRNGRTLGLIHRDISPHNIFLCFDGQVKLTDFGVAKVAESNIKTQVGITKGKLGYMSPEQLMGSQLDFRSDLYNVGILLYETITGKPLFGGATTAEFLQAMVRGIVPPMPTNLQVPPDLENLVRRSLDRDRNKRPASALEFERELEQITQAYNLSAQPAHVSHHLKDLYGKLEVPKLAKPVTAPQKLKSMMLATMAPQQPQPQPVQTPQPQPQYQAMQPPPSQPQQYQPQYQAPPQQPQYQPPPQQPQYQPPQPPQYQPPQPPQYQPPQPQQYQQPQAAQQTWNDPQTQVTPPKGPENRPQSGAKQNPSNSPQWGEQPNTDYPDDDGATLVRPSAPEPPPQAPRAASDPRAPQQRQPSRPAIPNPERQASQPRVQVAVSQRMRTVDVPPRSSQPQMPQVPPQAPQWGQAPVAAVEDTPASPSSVFEPPVVTAEIPRVPNTAISEENRRPSTVARGNARPLEAPPSTPRPSSNSQPQPVAQPQLSPLDGDDNATRVEVNPLLRPPPAAPGLATPPTTQPMPQPPPTQQQPPRQPTVTVGNSAVGVRSKKVVPLDDTRKR